LSVLTEAVKATIPLVFIICEADFNDPFTKQALTVEGEVPAGTLENDEQQESVPEHSVEAVHFLPASTVPQSLTA
jgi:hypothetical protein